MIDSTSAGFSSHAVLHVLGFAAVTAPFLLVTCMSVLTGHAADNNNKSAGFPQDPTLAQSSSSNQVKISQSAMVYSCTSLSA